MSRARLFIENIVIYGFGGMLSKLIPFAMLPVVTRLMPDSGYFGLSDLTTTIVSFAQAVAVMGMYDAMFRMFFETEQESYRKKVCSTAFLFVTGSSLVVAICVFLLQDPISRVFFGSAEYASLVVISAISTFFGANNSIAQAPTRMHNKHVVFIIMNLVTAILSYAIAIPLLMAGQYLIALPVAALLASFSSLCIFYLLNRKWFSLRDFDLGHLKRMLVIGLPLMPNFLIYWVFNSCDRLMLVNFIGIGAAGVYAVASKMGQISQLIYMAFAQGWQYFAFSTMKDDDQIELNSRIYEYLGVVSFMATALIMIVMDPLFGALFEESYLPGIVCVPYLFLAPLLLMLYQVASNQLLVIRKTWPSLLILGAGCITNLVSNFCLIPNLGIEGAAIGTLAGYSVSNVVAMVVLCAMGLMRMSKRLYIDIAAFSFFFLSWRLVLHEFLPGLVVAGILLMVLYFALYKKELLMLTKKFVGRGDRQGRSGE